MPDEAGSFMNALMPLRDTSSLVPPIAASAIEPETSWRMWRFATGHCWHDPFWHTPAQKLLHAPQCAGLVLVSTHCPPQSVSPTGHWQPPFRQVAPAGHFTLQPPQFCSSLEVSMHPPLHGVRRHVQLPPAHEYPGAHWLLHPPQFSGSTWVSTQSPLQIVALAEQTHCPLWQVAAEGHAMKHPPQWLSSELLSTHSAPHALAAGQAQAPLWQVVRPGHVAPSSTCWSQSSSLPSQVSGAPG